MSLFDRQNLLDNHQFFLFIDLKIWYQAHSGQSDATPGERKVRTVFREFTRIPGQLFVYSKFLQADITIQGYFKKEKSYI
jgi:hypothetical protein